MQSLRHVLLASVALGSLGVADVASAQTAIYAGGASFPAIVYRQLFDCFNGTALDGNFAGTGVTGTSPYTGVKKAALALNSACASPDSGIEILYAPTGSGAGKTAIKGHNPAKLTSTALSSPAVPYVSSSHSAYFYPAVDFIGSDDPWLTSDASAWNATDFGKLVQIPSLAGPISIAINGNDGNGTALNIQNATPANGSSGLNLSRQALCGIVSGHITTWDNPILTALNNGAQLGTGAIKFVHRSDGSGSTFILSNALIAQCAGETGPDANNVTVSYAFPWPDTTDCTKIRAANTLAWSNTNACTSVRPVRGTFVDASGNSGVASVVKSTNGAIGYSTADYVQPVNATGPAAANIENQAGNIVPPAVDNVQLAVETIDLSSLDTPLKVGDATLWSDLMVAQVQNPVADEAYPIVGFTYMDFYQCYEYDAARPVVNTIYNYLSFHFFEESATEIINSNGFVTVQGQVFDKIIEMLIEPLAAPINNGYASPGCTTQKGAAKIGG